MKKDTRTLLKALKVALSELKRWKDTAALPIRWVNKIINNFALISDKFYLKMIILKSQDHSLSEIIENFATISDKKCFYDFEGVILYLN